jgi:DNA repair protein RecN (Recombination protein N)
LLVSLTIRNFVLIQDAVLEFEPGLNVLTGETGAGKTLLTRALGLLMGERAEDGLVGQAAADATIQALFLLNDEDAAGIPVEVRELVGGIGPGELIVSRRLGKEGRNRCYLNDTAVTLGAMGGAVAGLLSFAGQHEYRRLLDPRYQLAVLDQWAGADALSLASHYRDAFDKAREAGRLLQEGKATQEGRLREIDLLRFQVDELSEATLSADEEESLSSEQRLLARAEDVVRGTGAAAALLRSEDDQADVAGLLLQAGGHLAALSGVDPALDAMTSSLTALQYELSELAREMRGYAARVSVDPARLEMTNERLRRYMDMARKYGGSTDSALAHLADGAVRLAELEGKEEDLGRLEQAETLHSSVALELAGALSARRRQAAPLLEDAVATQLADLAMPSARVSIDLKTMPEWRGLRETGADTVEFLLAANSGQPARSLARTASGGELSRVLLGIKCALAGAGGHETLVFDEVDAGIGGRTAVAVANKLRELGGHSQVLVITHLAQVAALSSRHFVIDKASESGNTVARLTPVTGEAVTLELCRMLGGRTDDAEAMAHARDLRDRATGGLLD